MNRNDIILIIANQEVSHTPLILLEKSDRRSPYFQLFLGTEKMDLASLEAN